jgi:hypothetical protein
MAADSTMLRMVNLLIALSLGVHREQLEQRMGLTWPRPFLLRPLDARFLTILTDSDGLVSERFRERRNRSAYRRCDLKVSGGSVCREVVPDVGVSRGTH